jgi:hypothetical protein
MGIRFRCPNGHKLHVKSFLAGKRGICPECGVKVEIPAQSESGMVELMENSEPPDEAAGSRQLSSSADRVADTNAESDVQSARPRIELGIARPVAAGVQPDLPSAPSPEGTPGDLQRPLRPLVFELPQGIGSASAPLPVADPSDPFLQSPTSVWYVRPPQGGQYGPASSQVMRAWVEEGRVPPESQIWAEGWPEWRTANQVLPAEMLEAAGRRLQGAVPLTAQAGPTMSSIAHVRRRQARRWSLAVVATLGLFCAILFAALIYVVKFMN